MSATERRESEWMDFSDRVALALINGGLAPDDPSPRDQMFVASRITYWAEQMMDESGALPKAERVAACVIEDWNERQEAAAKDVGASLAATDGSPAATTARPHKEVRGEWACECNGEGKCGFCHEEAVCRAEALGDVRQERGLDGEWEGEERP